MRLVALECATERCSVALWIDGEVRTQSVDGTQQRNSESLLPMMGSLLQEAGLSLQNMDVIAFGAGPGAFTGLRVACGVAQGLAFGAGLPVVGVSSMEILAQGMRNHLGPQKQPIHLLAVMDARMGEVYSAELMESGEDWHVMHGPSLSRPEALPLAQSQLNWGVGDGFILHTDALLNRLESPLTWVKGCLQVPDAVPLAQLAAYRFQQYGGIPPEEAHPIYVRDKVALTSAERAQAR